MEWINTLYKNTRAVWEKNGKNSSGYAIFYSPVVDNPELLIMGYNPGGDEGDFSSIPMTPPAEHDYICGNYKMANRMRYIFESANMLENLQNSVKMNLIFFRTKSASTVKQLPAENVTFCYSQTKKIIDSLAPKTILVEGLETFDKLIGLLGVKRMKEHKNIRKKTLMRYSTYNGIKVLGIPHPSGSHGLYNDDLLEIGHLIQREIIS